MKFLIFAVCLFAVYPQVRPQTDEEIRSTANSAWAVDYQKFSTSQLQYNTAGPTFFTDVHESKLLTGGTYPKFRKLLDNYNPFTGVAEPPCPSCVVEENDWLDAVINSAAMDVVWTFLKSHNKASALHNNFRDELRAIWFAPYSRSSGPLDSSGFEHVFVGEIKNNAVSGFHNWVQSYEEEKTGDWRLTTTRRSCLNRIEALQFTWLGYSKSTSSIIMGASPELELAIFTMCLKVRKGSNCPVRFSGINHVVTTWDYQGVETIGSAYINC